MKKRKKKQKNNFVHLHCHNMYSVLDGVGKLDIWANKAKELRFEALASTNHGNIYDAIKFQKACKEKGIKSILGCELYCVENKEIKEKGEKRYHITVLIKNENGFKNLMKMLTSAWTEGFYYRPRISFSDLLKYQDGLIFMSACASSLLLHDKGLLTFIELYKKNKQDVYLEIMPHKLEIQETINLLCLKINKKYGIPIVATNDCHYPEKDDSIIQEVLLAIQTKKKWNDPDRWKFEINGLYLKTREEMIMAFKRYNKDYEPIDMEVIHKALDNTTTVADSIDFEITKKEVFLPLPPSCEGEEENDKLISLCGEKFEMLTKAFSNKKKDIYKERLQSELHLIIKMKFSRYFLIVWDLINFCNNNDIMVGPGRGSSGGSLVCYLLGITKVDPIKYNLLFSRFISPARIDIPDIDMDFEDIKRGEVRDYLEKIYGQHHVASVNTFSTLAGRGALRDVGRTFDLPTEEVDAAAKSIVVRSGGDVRKDFSISDAFETFEDGIKFKEKYPNESEIAMRLEGTVRGVGTHAAGMVVSKYDLRSGNNAYLEDRKGQLTICWDKHDSETMGLMKLDVLGLSALSVLQETKKLVKKNKEVDIIWEDIDLDNKEVFRQFSKGNNIACFQFGSLGLRRFTQDIGINSFMELVDANALFRPGTLRSGLDEKFIKLKKGIENPKYVHRKVKEITKDTYGIILYQEQIMLLLYQLGRIGWKTTDTIRKVVSKSEGIEKFKKFEEIFVNGCIKNKTIDEKTARKVFQELKHFGSYGFNKSHAVEYTMISYWDMWAKIYYPAEFMAANLTYGPKDKSEDYIKEARRLGLSILPPKINLSTPFNWFAKDKMLIAPLVFIKGIGNKIAERIASAKEGIFVDGEEELKEITKGLRVTKKHFESLSILKAYDEKATFTDEEYEKVLDHLSVDFRIDTSYHIKPLINKIKDKVNIVPLSETSKKGEKHKEVYKYHFVRMVDIKYGYKGGETENYNDKSDDLGGGVYGNIGDESDHCLAFFETEFYKENKEKCEHCAGQHIIVKLTKKKSYSHKIQKAWFEEDILEGNLQGMKVELRETIDNRKRIQLKDISKRILNCKECELVKKCDCPVPPSIGKYNYMIIGEAPGRKEDEKGIPFYGPSGNTLFKYAKKLRREEIYITNVVKCFPNEIKTPKSNHINCCQQFLDKELLIVRPFLVLCLGNIAQSFFTGKNTGILDLAGKTIWNKKYNCWICFSVHPSFLLRDPDNKEKVDIFRKGINNFLDKYKILR